MSETQTETPAVETPAVTTEVVTEAAPQQEQQQQATTEEQQPEQPEQPKPRGDRRFAQVTARLAAKDQEIAELRRQFDAQRAILEAQGKETPQPTGSQDVEARAREIVEQQAFNQRRDAVVMKGNKEFGGEAWKEKTDALGAMGAYDNPAFLRALVDVPDAHKVAAHLADDPDALAALLSKPPLTMATEMGRMSAELSRPAARPVSQAPRPVTPVTTPAVVPEPTAYDENLSMADYVALRRKTAPRHLGGSR
jgi:hypothetical protein